MGRARAPSRAVACFFLKMMKSSPRPRGERNDQESGSKQWRATAHTPYQRKPQEIRSHGNSGSAWDWQQFSPSNNEQTTPMNVMKRKIEVSSLLLEAFFDDQLSGGE